LINRGAAAEKSRQEKAMKPAALVATIFLALVAFAQFLRVELRVEVTAGGVAVPLWASALVSVFMGGLSLMLWRESGR
jgi:hypothetical protein